MTAKNFTGAAAATTLSAGIASGTTSFAVADGSTYPSANFNIVIDKGLSGEEKVFISSRSGNTFTVSARGADSTTAAAHSSGASVQHCGFALDFQENNDHVNGTGTVHAGATVSPGALIIPTATSPAQTAEGSAVWDSDDNLLTVGDGAARKTMADTSSTQTLTGKTLTTPTIGDFTNANHTHASSAQGGAVSVAGASMTSYVPVVGGTGWALGNGTISGSYVQVGKMVHVWIYWDLGSTSTFSASQQGTLTLPVAADTTIQLSNSLLGLTGSYVGLSSNTHLLLGSLASSTTMAIKYPDDSLAANVRAVTFTSGVAAADSSGYIFYSGIYVAA